MTAKYQVDSQPPLQDAVELLNTLLLDLCAKYHDAYDESDEAVIAGIALSLVQGVLAGLIDTPDERLST